MNAVELLLDAFGRIREEVHGVLDGADAAALTHRPGADANTPAWLVWHLTRVQDDHVADVAGVQQVWTRDGWAGRFQLPFADSATGYGQSADEVAAVQVSADLLAGYHDAVAEATAGYLRGLAEDDLDRVVDEDWDPPVTLGARLVSVLSDDLQHVGQAAYVLGLSRG
ncbi:mycothiol transferase [Nakamurella endophytica]|uniref:DUF664 domain-containing protein n=1 Tax=Nakamurella endophytica TaxID=1748367 RepID=A0A917SQ88_9ACTN|nr:DUF664 domain-containing protein [Nakamurella endophytica]GGL92683.1 hypothetical protein GCM10011594_10560 [Nakamurella endophytica]